MVIGFELIYVETLLSEYLGPVRLSRNIIFGIGMFMLLGGEIWMRYSVESKVDELADSVRIKKSERSSEPV